MSIHLAAKVGEIAENVLLPGDPMRAKYIAENFLENPVLYNEVRGTFGYTGTYKGKPVSVQATGMGIPSISIYVHELLTEFKCKKLIRIGTCGGMVDDLKLRDIVIAQGVTTDSSIIRNIFGPSINYSPLADFELLKTAYDKAKALDYAVRVGNIITVDRFYDDEIDNEKLAKYQVLAVEMETAALYLLGAEYNAQTLAIFTVTDHLFKKLVMSPEDREKSLNEMITLGLETAIA